MSRASVVSRASPEEEVLTKVFAKGYAKRPALSYEHFIPPNNQFIQLVTQHIVALLVQKGEGV
jgi:hypothetical protein